ncbi:MAG: ribbon-helix-helix domain-containing protein [Verrucomicrobiota bacterium]|nr:ribbon-helix-helix domain-containing protein [Verrucomicrobiota bacterium]MDQ6939037.1 ribbon-helix-helix domain-containing protein [Verrucomicrobiota bacterium]
MNETLSIKVPVQTKVRLKSIAKRRQTTPSKLLREALDLVLAGQKANGRPSLYDLSRDLFEKYPLGSGPRDLSTNPKYMKDFGKDGRRFRSSRLRDRRRTGRASA